MKQKELQNDDSGRTETKITNIKQTDSEMDVIPILDPNQQ